MATSPTTPPRSPLTSPGVEIVYESYLHKTPPLDKLFVKWKKRWFVLSRTDMYEQSSLDLSYYTDHTKTKKRGTINLAKFIGIRPNARIGNKENIFAIETEERKYILRAGDQTTKTIWLAKLCEVCGQEPVYHVYLANQPSVSSPGDGILKFKMPGGTVAVISPINGNTLMEISLVDIRRIGCMRTQGNDIIWFETCKSCKSSQGVDQFMFAVVPSGTLTAQALTKEVKVAIERTTGAFLILEDSSQTEMTFVSRSHYGCPCFPALSRNRILVGGLNECFEKRLMKFHRSSEPILNVGMAHLQHRTSIDQYRKPSDALANMGLSLEEYVTQPHRRGTISSCSSSTPYSSRPPLSRKPTSLDKLRKASISSLSSQNSVDMGDELVHTPLSDAVFDHELPITRRQITRDDSITSSQGSPPSRGSTGSYVMTVEQEEQEMEPMRRRSQSKPDLHKPNIPPRSQVSLRTKHSPVTVK